jgi:hypothetical protein
MIWAILVFVGVPLWLCALGILTVVVRSHRLRSRHGNIPVRVLRPGHTRWVRAQAVWVSDVFAWRGSPAAWSEDLVQVVDLHGRPANSAEIKKLHRLGEEPAVVELSSAEGETFTVATAGTDQVALLGPFTPDRATVPLPPAETAAPTPPSTATPLSASEADPTQGTNPPWE